MCPMRTHLPGSAWGLSRTSMQAACWLDLHLSFPWLLGRIQQNQVQIPALPLTGCVTLSKSLALSINAPLSKLERWICASQVVHSSITNYLSTCAVPGMELGIRALEEQDRQCLWIMVFKSDGGSQQEIIPIQRVTAMEEINRARHTRN